MTGREMFYEMVALCVSGKVSNYFRHYANLVHFLPQLKQIQNYFRDKFVIILINYRYCQ